MKPSNSKIWLHADNPDSGVIHSWSELIAGLEKEGSVKFPDLRKNGTLYIFSDYGGDHQDSEFYCYSFLLIDSESFNAFVQSQDKFWMKYKLDNRTINYKSLRDKVKQRALIPFLKFCDGINGLLVSCIFSKKVESLFIIDEKSSLNHELSLWKKEVMEKLLRLVHLVTLFVNGLSKQSQNIVWITDNDDVVANEIQLIGAKKLFEKISLQHLMYSIGNFSFERNSTGDNKSNFEKLCSLPDLSSGALVELLSHFNRSGVQPVEKKIVPFPSDVKLKVLPITNWLSNKSDLGLRKLTLMVKESDNNLMTTAVYKFHELNNEGPEIL